MWRAAKQVIFVAAFSAILLLSVSTDADAQGAVCANLPGETCHSGRLKDAATYLIEVPANWNGTLFLYSHGYVVPGEPNPAQDVGDPATGAFLLPNGFALPRCAYVHTWG